MCVAREHRTTIRGRLESGDVRPTIRRICWAEVVLVNKISGCIGRGVQTKTVVYT